jgi:hypothetical protein
MAVNDPARVPAPPVSTQLPRIVSRTTAATWRLPFGSELKKMSKSTVVSFTVCPAMGPETGVVVLPSVSDPEALPWKIPFDWDDTIKVPLMVAAGVDWLAA